MFTLDSWFSWFDACPWGTIAGRSRCSAAEAQGRLLYTIEERRRRDASPLTTVQAVLAPVQFAVFLLSVGFVLHYLITGNGLTAATASIVVKTIALYAIMITGAMWEKDVFGRYLFAPAFFYEDAFSMLVIALHTGYLAALLTGYVSTQNQMLIALAAYAAYLFNAIQFLMKLRAARREEARWPIRVGSAAGARG
ncbi:MAG: 2-vinyl bacteriochlorophyllide hydratase [Proteobacteria bacterium]|nr:2-vinyl bacteriochlorophyllide hydratase [Pseudomonadota bacterium]